VHGWIDEFGIDGLRLDVAYMVDRDFLRRLRWECSQHKEDFFLLGEMLHGDYKQIMNEEMCHSVTNYECYKGLYSSFNSMNLFEIVHSLQRQFGPEPWTLYKGQHLLSFADNHDVTRTASILQEPAHLPLLYTILFAMPGIPMIYYGSEWGMKGDKSWGDQALRPAAERPEWNELTDHIARLVGAWKESRALQYGAFRSLLLTNRQCVLERGLSDGSERILAAVNADGEPFTAYFDAGAGSALDLLSGKEIDLGSGLSMPPFSSFLLRV
jgi:glycosidase